MEIYAYRDLLSRLASFDKWPYTAQIPPVKFAEAGLFYTGISDELQCYKCGAKTRNWTRFRTPEQGHLCENLNNTGASNYGASSTEYTSPSSYRNNGSYSKPNLQQNKEGLEMMQIKTKADATRLLGNKSNLENWHIEKKDDQARGWDDGFMDSSDGRYKDEVTRLMSFDSSWPRGVPVDKTELAKAGWYYTGIVDRVKCPWCSGCVYNWAPGDTGLGEHRRHFPHCPFVAGKLKESLEAPVVKAETKVVEQKCWQDLPCVKAVIGLGYSEDLVEKVVKNLESRGVNRSRFCTDLLLDEIFESSNKEVKDAASSAHDDPQEEIDRQHNHTQLLTENHFTDSGNDTVLMEDSDTTSSAQEDKVMMEEAIAGQKKNHTFGSETFDMEDIEKLKKENETLRANMTCKVCFDAKVGELFLPCRHLVCCTECAASVRRCPFCRERIIGTIKAFV